MKTRYKVFLALTIIAVPLFIAGLIGTFYFTPLEVKQIGFNQKIFYFHVPMAITSGVAFLVTLIGSLAYIVTRDEKYDKWAASAAEIGLVFSAMLLLMGILWGRAAWGVWWTWDPRLTSYLVVVLLYMGYFVLRSSVESTTQRARYSAALGTVSYMAVIFTMISTRILRSTHPVIFSLHNSGVEPEMLYTFLLALFGTFALFGAILVIRVSIENIREEIEDLKDMIG